MKTREQSNEVQLMKARLVGQLYRDTIGVPHKQIAEKLGVSLKTVQRLRDFTNLQYTLDRLVGTFIKLGYSPDRVLEIMKRKS